MEKWDSFLLVRLTLIEDSASNQLTIGWLGPDAIDPISCMAMEGDNVWAASGSDVIKYYRGKEVSPLHCFMIFDLF